MQVRHFNILLLRVMNQLESITDEGRRMRFFRTLSDFSNKARKAERSQLSLRSIIKRHARTLRNNLEHYDILKIIQQFLSTLDTLKDP